jgi:hypothetical protein
MLAAIRRQNPALPPRWSKAAAAVRLALKVRAGDGEKFDRALAAIALDTRSHGPLSDVMHIVAERAALDSFEPEPYRIGRLMTVRFHSLAGAINAALMFGESHAWQWFTTALSGDEIAPDRGEIWAAIRRLPFPVRELAVLRKEHCQLFDNEGIIAAADRAIAAAAKAAEPVPAEELADTTPRGH